MPSCQRDGGSSTGGNTTGGNTTGGNAPQSPDAPARPPGARQVAVAAIADEQLVQAVLDECHGPIQRRMQQVQVTVTLPDARRLLVHADLPDRARVHAGNRDYVWVEQEVHRIDSDGNSDASNDDQDRARIAPLAGLVDAIAFGPLYRATHCQRVGADFLLTDAAGTKTTLQLHDGTLLPRALIYAHATVRFDAYLRTKTTWVVNRATTKVLGTCDAIFEDGGVLFGQKFFATSDGKAASKDAVRMTAPGVVRERESATPIVVTGRAAQWVVLAAPEDWSDRHAIYKPVHQALEAQDQMIFGFPMLWQEQGQQLLGVPFVQRKDGKALQPPADWQIRSSQETRQLVVYPQTGSLAERIRTGTELLQRAVANRKFQVLGPIIAQPFLHLHDGAPNQSKLQNCKVRVSVRIQSS